MGTAAGARDFTAGGDAYDHFMGRYARRLAAPVADFADVRAGLTVLDVGCGPGAFTTEAVRRVGAERVTAVDPSPPFVQAIAERLPGVTVYAGAAESLPVADDSFDRVVSQLVLHFVSEPDAAATEFIRVARPGAVIAACVWDFAEGMQMLRSFWDAALTVDPEAPDEAQRLRFGNAGEIADLWRKAGLTDIREQTIEVRCGYSGFDDLWSGFMVGIGPAGAWLLAQSEDVMAAVRAELFTALGSPDAGFELSALARVARGTVAG